jgi:hypothetical protein
VSYHRFPNFREKLKNDLTTNIMIGVFNTDHVNGNCIDCTAPSLVLVFMEVNAGRVLLSTVSNAKFVT